MLPRIPKSVNGRPSLQLLKLKTWKIILTSFLELVPDSSRESVDFTNHNNKGWSNGSGGKVATQAWSPMFGSQNSCKDGRRLDSANLSSDLDTYSVVDPPPHTHGKKFLKE